MRPPLIYDDVVRPSAMTVKEFVYAQSLTKKPVKGMLTGVIHLQTCEEISQWLLFRSQTFS